MPKGRNSKPCQHCGEMFIGAVAKRQCSDACYFWSRVKPTIGDACWPWLGRRMVKEPYGVGVFFGKTHFLAHRMSWILHFGPIPDGLLVCHRCDNPPCVNPQHFFLGDDAANSADRKRKGRGRPAYGERSGTAKLVAANVIEIRRRRASGESTASIGRDFGVTNSMVSHICTRRAWRHIA
jgi:hypothetical protein